MSAPDAGTAAAGWYPDPYAQATYRWFDGAVWTAQVHDVTPVAPAVPPAATSVPFVADPTLGATTTAGYSAAGASTASGSRFGTPTYADQTVHGGTTRSGYAPGGYAPGSGYAGGYAAGAASPAYGTVAPFGVAQPMSYAAPRTNRRALVGAAVLAVVVVAAALAAPHVFPRLAHHTLAMTAPDTLAGAAVDTSADGQARLDQVRPTLQQAFSQLPEHPVAVTQRVRQALEQHGSHALKARQPQKGELSCVASHGADNTRAVFGGPPGWGKTKDKRRKGTGEAATEVTPGHGEGLRVAQRSRG